MLMTPKDVHRGIVFYEAGTDRVGDRVWLDKVTILTSPMNHWFTPNGAPYPGEVPSVCVLARVENVESNCARESKGLTKIFLADYGIVEPEGVRFNAHYSYLSESVARNTYTRLVGKDFTAEEWTRINRNLADPL